MCTPHESYVVKSLVYFHVYVYVAYLKVVWSFAEYLDTFYGTHLKLNGLEPCLIGPIQFGYVLNIYLVRQWHVTL